MDELNFSATLAYCHGLYHNFYGILGVVCMMFHVSCNFWHLCFFCSRQQSWNNKSVHHQRLGATNLRANRYTFCFGVINYLSLYVAKVSGSSLLFCLFQEKTLIKQIILVRRLEHGEFTFCIVFFFSCSSVDLAQQIIDVVSVCLHKCKRKVDEHIFILVLPLLKSYILIFEMFSRRFAI